MQHICLLVIAKVDFTYEVNIRYQADRIFIDYMYIKQNAMNTLETKIKVQVNFV